MKVTVSVEVESGDKPFSVVVGDEVIATLPGNLRLNLETMAQLFDAAIQASLAKQSKVTGE